MHKKHLTAEPETFSPAPNYPKTTYHLCENVTKKYNLKTYFSGTYC